MQHKLEYYVVGDIITLNARSNQIYLCFKATVQCLGYHVNITSAVSDSNINVIILDTHKNILLN